MSISKAIEFSAKAHEGHFRKGSQVPYMLSVKLKAPPSGILF